MTRFRWAALVAVLVLVIVGDPGSGAGRVAPDHGRLAVATGAPSDSLSARPEATGPALVAVEAGRGPAVARPEGSPGMRWLAASFLAVACLAAARGWRPLLRLLLALAIRCQTEWWRPTPGGRAPPRLTPAPS